MRKARLVFVIGRTSRGWSGHDTHGAQTAVQALHTDWGFEVASDVVRDVDVANEQERVQSRGSYTSVFVSQLEESGFKIRFHKVKAEEDTWRSERDRTQAPAYDALPTLDEEQLGMLNQQDGGPVGDAQVQADSRNASRHTSTAGACLAPSRRR